MYEKVITQQTLSNIRKIDLLTYLHNREPSELVKDKNGIYHTATHDSLKISNGKWFWWSRGIGGRSALDYLVSVRGMKFKDAVEKLSGEIAFAPPIAEPENKKYLKVYLPRYTFLCPNVRRYLASRGIDDEVVSEYISKKMIAEDVNTKNALFFGYDDVGKIRQCSIHSTYGASVKKEAAGSDKTYCFKSLSETNKTSLRVFESAIDLLSFATLMKQNGRDYHSENLISLSGVFRSGGKNSVSKVPAAIQKYLDEHRETKKFYLHFDNDEAGKFASDSIISALENDYDVRYVPPTVGKDFNDLLMIKTKNAARKRKNYEGR